MRRSLLRKQLFEAWSESIDKDYACQRINSERSLQASLWSKLNARLDPQTRRMFIEPGLKIEQEKQKHGSQIRYPDLVVCNTRVVIGIIEIKYRPRTKPVWKKDVASLEWIASNRDAIRVRNSRFRGIEADGRSYPLAANILFVWAGIHAKSDVILRDLLPSNSGTLFLSCTQRPARERAPESGLNPQGRDCACPLRRVRKSFARRKLRGPHRLACHLHRPAHALVRTCACNGRQP